MNNETNFGTLNINNTFYKTRLSKKFIERKPYKPRNPKIILSFIPGTILEILVQQGQSVAKGDDLIILEAMKMQNKLKSIVEGRIKKVLIGKGDRVSKGSLLIELE